jgi:hypothetical protein
MVPLMGGLFTQMMLEALANKQHGFQIFHIFCVDFGQNKVLFYFFTPNFERWRIFT